MAPCNSNSPIDIVPSKATGTCDLKCFLKFNYQSSNCVVTNKGDHYSLTYQQHSTPPVIYSDEKYQIREARIYMPSLHSFNGTKALGELMLIHSGMGKNLIICIPINGGLGAVNKPAKFLETVANNISKFATQSNQNVSLGNASWNLDEWIPNDEYYTYTGHAAYGPCNGTVEYVVFNSNNSIKISNSTVKKLQSHIIAANYPIQKNKFYKSSHKAVNSLNESMFDDEIYISCQPVGQSEEHTVVSDKKDKDQFEEFVKLLDPRDSIIMQSLLGVVIMYGLFRGAQAAFSAGKKK